MKLSLGVKKMVGLELSYWGKISRVYSIYFDHMKNMCFFFYC